MTCFDPCTGPSSGLNLRWRRLYSVFLQPKVSHYNLNEISLFCGTVLLAKHYSYVLTLPTFVWLLLHNGDVTIEGNLLSSGVNMKNIVSNSCFSLQL